VRVRRTAVETLGAVLPGLRGAGCVLPPALPRLGPATRRVGTQAGQLMARHSASAPATSMPNPGAAPNRNKPFITRVKSSPLGGEPFTAASSTTPAATTMAATTSASNQNGSQPPPSAMIVFL